MKTAEAAGEIRDEASACSLYVRAVDEGMVNANSRPRADDLNERCRSVALQGIAPSDELLMKLQKMRNELGTPW